MYANLAENWQRVSHRLELNQEFDLIESIVESIADRNGVDAEAVWADLESLTEDELYVFAVTSEPIMEDWQKANKRDKTDGMSRKAVKAYRREHPGSKLQTAVTTKPGKLKKGSKASKRRKSYCSRSRGQMKMHHISCAKTPDKAICKARRRWNCEGVEPTQTMLESNDVWGPQGNFAGDKHIDVGGVSIKPIQVGDVVKYLGQKSEVVGISKNRKYARITIASGMGGTTKDVLTSDLQQLGQGMSEGDMYGDQEVSWEKGGRRAPTGAFRNPAAEKMSQAEKKKPAEQPPKEKSQQGVAEADDPKFVGFMNKAMANKVDAPKADPLAKAPDWYKNAPAMNFDSMPSHKKALQFGLKVLSKLDPETKQQLAAGGEWAICEYIQDVAERTGKLNGDNFVEEDIWECQDYLSNAFHDPNITSWVDVLKTGVNEAKQKAVPSSQRDPGALATRSHIASQEKKHATWAQKQKALADEFYKNHPELDDRPKPMEENSMADELARLAMKRNPNALVRVDGKTLQSPAPGPKPAGTTTPRPASKFDPEAEYSDDYSAWHRRTKGLSEDSNDILEAHRKLNRD
jgi:hypothetical protein